MSDSIFMRRRTYNLFFLTDQLLANLWTWRSENKLTDFDAIWQTWSAWQGHEPINLGGHEVKGQGYGRPTLDLEAWWRHRSWPHWVE